MAANTTVYMPSMDEIEAACEAIRETWTIREEMVRRGLAIRNQKGLLSYEIPQGLRFVGPMPRHGNYQPK